MARVKNDGLIPFLSETKTAPPTLPDDSEEEDDYSRYLKGDDMPKYDNEHKEFKAAEKDMQKKQHEKVTKVRLKCFFSKFTSPLPKCLSLVS